MAQYYQIVGQGPSLTLEELQRYYPNIRLDSIALVNQDDQQYAQQQVVVQPAEPPSDIVVSNAVQPQAQLVVGDGLPYQQQYIIRHEPAPSRNDFQQQQQQQQQALHRQQVYYTSDLPVDAHAQVVLQQAQQIIDASMMQQPTQQRPQHVCLSVIIVYL
ncbi:homeotic protein antennapedia-like isoform X2 [Hyposmocoma kahamanoa]|uniref:homeotic protein antennapedia-like isoform X2 n=1 Tax=Hyposmocoma kahamanoa TaxID=1477025 RepID=UPI000E6D64E0|nr:homeotic protein antennapedia-like isoform X2 [Hyposmocoma kahamanoa]